MAGFHVDVGALKQASEGVDGVLQDVHAVKVSDIDPDSSTVGHDRLSGSLSDFTDRWQRGVDNLAKDGQEIASRLRDSLADYEKVERETKQKLDTFLQGSGPDPAAS